MAAGEESDADKSCASKRSDIDFPAGAVRQPLRTHAEDSITDEPIVAIVCEAASGTRPRELVVGTGLRRTRWPARQTRILPYLKRGEGQMDLSDALESRHAYARENHIAPCRISRSPPRKAQPLTVTSSRPVAPPPPAARSAPAARPTPTTGSASPRTPAAARWLRRAGRSPRRCGSSRVR